MSSFSTAKITDIQQLRVNIREARSEMGRLRFELMEINLLISRYGRLAQACGLPPEINEAITKLIRLSIIITQLIHAYQMLQAAQAGAGPIGWALAIGGIAMTALMAGEFIYDCVRSYE